MRAQNTCVVRADLLRVLVAGAVFAVGSSCTFAVEHNDLFVFYFFFMFVARVYIHFALNGRQAFKSGSYVVRSLNLVLYVFSPL
jgi:hypothetical protein